MEEPSAVVERPEATERGMTWWDSISSSTTTASDSALCFANFLTLPSWPIHIRAFTKARSVLFTYIFLSRICFFGNSSIPR